MQGHRKLLLSYVMRNINSLTKSTFIKSSSFLKVSLTKSLYCKQLHNLLLQGYICFVFSDKVELRYKSNLKSKYTQKCSGFVTLGFTVFTNFTEKVDLSNNLINSNIWCDISDISFHISDVHKSQKVKDVLIWKPQHIIFIWTQGYWQVFDSALVYL